MPDDFAAADHAIEQAADAIAGQVANLLAHTVKPWTASFAAQVL
ncbi:MAG TPA: hypothetical protein VNX28_02240 [Gemmataceae bacterium]|jgi:hypothetical protein|nr:hypothetical protein [Gemmataceae bacterium]